MMLVKTKEFLFYVWLKKLIIANIKLSLEHFYFHFQCFLPILHYISCIWLFSLSCRLYIWVDFFNN